MSCLLKFCYNAATWELLKQLVDEFSAKYVVNSVLYVISLSKKCQKCLILPSQSFRFPAFFVQLECK